MRRRLFYFSLFFTSLLLWGCGQAPSAVTQGPSGSVPNFSLKNLQNEDVALQSALAKNKAVLVNFWATWCPPCREEIPDLIKLEEKYKDKGFTILGIDVGESAERVQSFSEKAGMNYPLLLDVDNAVAETYRVVGIPTTYLLNSEGKVLGEYHAFTPQLESDVEKALQ